MNRDGYLIGIDSGTSGIKAVVFDLLGKELFVKREPLDGIIPFENWYEQDMNVIWEKCLICLKDVMAKVEKELILGIGITAQGDGLWMIDENGDAVRSGICFCDGRTDEEIRKWRKEGVLEKAFQICGTAVFGSAICAEIRWMEKHLPQMLDRATVFFHLKDWLFYKFTGKISTDDTDMSIPMLNARTKKYDEELFKLFGLEKYKDKFPDVYTTRENCAAMDSSLANELGLKDGIMVLGGPMDIPACALASGAIEDGQAATVIGTAAIHSVIMNEPRPEPYMAGMTISHCLPDRWIRLVSSLGGAPNLEWFLKNVGEGIRNQANLLNKDVYQYCSELIERVPIGSNGIVYHPYIMAGGERAPFFKDNIKGSFMGISYKTKIEDMLRSVYEGIAMAMVDCYKSVPGKLKEIYVSGGGAKSDVWMQIFADALNTDVVVNEGAELGAKGAAMNVGVALGIYKSYKDAVQITVHEKKRFHGNPENHLKYCKLYGLYKKGYELNMDWWDMRSRFLKEI